MSITVKLGVTALLTATCLCVPTAEAKTHLPTQEPGWTECHGSIDGPIRGDVHVADHTGCTINSPIFGDLRVGSQSKVLIQGASVHGDIVDERRLAPAMLVLTDATVHGSITLAGTSLLTQNTSVKGSLTASLPDDSPKGAGHVRLEDSSVDGATSVRGMDSFITGTTLGGDLTVAKGELFHLFSSKLRGELSVSSATMMAVVCGSSVAKSSLITGSGPVVLGPGFSHACDGVNHLHDVAVTASTAGQFVSHTHVDGRLSGSNNPDPHYLGDDVTATEFAGDFSKDKATDGDVDPDTFFQPTE